MFWAAFSGATRRTGLIPLFGNPEAERMVLQALLLKSYTDGFYLP
jgi:hypothetical protein